MRQCRTHCAFAALLLLFVAAPIYAQNLDPRLRKIDEYAAMAGRQWKVPGFTVAIIKDNKVILAKGYGVRELGKPGSVDKDTVFAIASNTKTFTSSALAMLVDEGKLRWDDDVRKYLPWFQMYDPWVTREMTVRDLLSHRSGLATFAGDLLWYESTYTREEIIRRIRFLKPTSSFRSRYGYQNLMFLTAGEIIPAVTGQSWDDFVLQRFFVPLGMTRTTSLYKQLTTTPNVATPHNARDGKIRVIHYVNVENTGGAAAINSSAADLAQWVLLHLGRGSYQGKRFFSADRSRDMWTPNTVIAGTTEQSEKFDPTVHFLLYGLGWLLNDYQGHEVIWHGGGLDGMTSIVAMMPEEDLGVVVLTNSESPLVRILSNKIFDEFLGMRARDWSADFLAREKQSEQLVRETANKLENSRVSNRYRHMLELTAGPRTAMRGSPRRTESSSCS